LDEMIELLIEMKKADAELSEIPAALAREFPDATLDDVEAAFDGAIDRLEREEAEDLDRRIAWLEAARAEAEQDLRDLRGETTH